MPVSYLIDSQHFTPRTPSPLFEFDTLHVRLLFTRQYLKFIPMTKAILYLLLWSMFQQAYGQKVRSWIRINQLGYPTAGVKVAVLGSKSIIPSGNFEIIDAATRKTVFAGPIGRSFGS